MLLRHVMDFNFKVTPERYVRIGEAMGLDLRGMTLRHKRAALLSQVTQLGQTVGIIQTLEQKGVHRTDVPQLAGKAIKDPCIVTNPRKPNTRDIEVIYEEAM
jgi:alcohol dehydrogenase class IV